MVQWGGVWDYARDEKFLSDATTDYLSGSERDWRPDELVAYAFGKPLFSGDFSSEQWTYTNTGNVLAALIAEKATNKPFKQILKEEILDPLGLKNTFFSSQDVSLEKRARGYEDLLTAEGTLGRDGILEETSRTNTEAVYATGSIVSSAADVAVFFDALASGDLLSSDSTGEIFNYVDTGIPGFNRFGLGVRPTELPWGETRSKSGDLPGYKSQLDYFLNSDTTISVLVNRKASLASDARPTLLLQAYKASIANTLGLDDGSAINGAGSDDYLRGSSDNEVLNGLEGDDIIFGQKGLDALDGGRGDDFLDGGEGNDYVFGEVGDDTLYGGRDNDFLNGGGGDDLLDGGKGDDSLIGGDGKDTIDGGKDNDFLSGGADNDILRDIYGNNVFYGDNGDDWLFAGQGDDSLYGDAGRDRIWANAGNDQLFGGIGDDILDGGQGDDALVGGEGHDTIAGGLGNDRILGGAGDDILRGDLNLKSPQDEMPGGDDTLFGGAGDDLIGGKSGNDTLHGNQGHDTLWGDAGDDVLFGGLGDDILIGDNSSAGAGNDTFVLAVGEGMDTIVDFQAGKDLIGLAHNLTFADLSFGIQGNNTLIQAGTETLAIVQAVGLTDLTETAFIPV